jgi:NodT family efflux transporter outer membrane factor (OMF) lipoprotein
MQRLLPTFMRCSRLRHPARPTFGARVAGLAVTALLSGCAGMVFPDGKSPAVPVPARWTISASPSMPEETEPGVGATSLGTWWQRFDDPQLVALIERSLLANTDMQSARATLLQARALRDVQAAGLLPGIGASASAQRSRSGGNPASNLFQAGFDASWEVDLRGARRSAVTASEADVLAIEAGLAATQVSLTAEVAINYIALRSLQERLVIARRNLESQTATLQIAQWRMQAGLSTSLVTEQARTAAEQTAAQIPALESSLAQTRHSLAVLTGQPPAALNAELDGIRAVPQAADDLALAIPAETLRQRPDVGAAEHRITAALARLSQADAARYPDFQLGGSLGLRALTVGALGNGSSVASSLLSSVSVPLFDGGAIRAQIRVQEATLEQAREAYRAVVLAALQDVEDALVALRGDRERLAHLQGAAEAAANAALLAQQRYRSGLIDFQTVLETQRSLLSAQDSVASTVAGISADHVRLYKALGGGWQ